MKRLGIFIVLIAIMLPLLLWGCDKPNEEPKFEPPESDTPTEGEENVAGTDLGLGIFSDSIESKDGTDLSCIVLKVTAADRYNNKTEDSFEVNVDENGAFSFYIPSNRFYVEVLLESLVEGYGISYYHAFVDNAEKKLGFFYSPITDVILESRGEAEVCVTFKDENKNSIYAEYSYSVELDKVDLTVPELNEYYSLDARVILNAVGRTEEYPIKYEFREDDGVVHKIHSLHEKGVITDERWINYICDVYLLYPELEDRMYLSSLFETVFYYYRDTEEIPEELLARIEENFDFSGIPMDGEVIID